MFCNIYPYVGEHATYIPFSKRAYYLCMFFEAKKQKGLKRIAKNLPRSSNYNVHVVQLIK